ncbi:hypothetical protein [Brevundimonas sp.]|jgi:uncharacterized membrane protein|uniref:hypothetical protein n=1 Tax=Brevundimonas sp. TaxID=1871086 RepID=UPI002E0EC238|nr:hypothetical protein [Brevundimonas sp.]
MTDERELDHWLSRLGWALSHLSESERADIVKEAVEDRVAAGASVRDVLLDFGPAERHARCFVDEIEAYEALGSQKAGALARFVVNRAHRSVVAASALLALVLLAVLASVAVLTVALKIFDPVHAGLWLGPGVAFVGVIDDPSTARELLGAWLFPGVAVFLTLVVIAARLLLSLVVPRLTTRSHLPPASLS